MTDVDFWRNCLDVQIDDQKLHGEPTVGPYRVAARTVVEGWARFQRLFPYHGHQAEPTASH